LTPSEKGDGAYDKLLKESLKIDETEASVAERLVQFSSELNNLDFDPETKVLAYLGENKDAKKIAEEIIGENDLPEGLKVEISKAKTGLAALIAVAKKQSGKLGREGLEAMKRAMCHRFDDIRLFGAVLTAGTNAGQIRGPMQMTFARSLEPIIPIESSITRVAITKASDFLKKQTEMGRKPWVSWAAYEQHGFYNAPLGADPKDGGTGVAREDLARYWEALANMFPVAKSASNGYMEAVELIVFVHDDAKGRSCAPFYMLRDKVKREKQDGATEETKGFTKVYKPIEVADDEELKANGITVHRPLKDLRPDLSKT
jgi:CRISPR-associated protein Csd2